MMNPFSDEGTRTNSRAFNQGGNRPRIQMSGRAPIECRNHAGVGWLFVPDFAVGGAVAFGVPGQGAAAVGGGRDVDGGDVAAGGLAREGAVELVDDLPALLR